MPYSFICTVMDVMEIILALHFVSYPVHPVVMYGILVANRENVVQSFINTEVKCRLTKYHVTCCWQLVTQEKILYYLKPFRNEFN